MKQKEQKARTTIPNVTCGKIFDEETQEEIKVIFCDFDNVDSAKEILKEIGWKKENITYKNLLIKGADVLLRFKEI